MVGYYTVQYCKEKNGMEIWWVGAFCLFLSFPLISIFFQEEEEEEKEVDGRVGSGFVEKAGRG